MSKQVKQMQMDVLKRQFQDIRDMVLLTVTGTNARAENQMRLALRKKNIRLQTVKNSLASRVFQELGLAGMVPLFQGPTTVAWGSSSVADLSKEIDAWAKKNKKLIPKGAVADGAVVTFEAAKKFPTRAEALGRVLQLALAPASRLAGQLQGAGGRLASQIRTLAERAEAAPAT